MVLASARPLQAAGHNDGNEVRYSEESSGVAGAVPHAALNDGFQGWCRSISPCSEIRVPCSFFCALNLTLNLKVNSARPMDGRTGLLIATPVGAPICHGRTIDAVRRS